MCDWGLIWLLGDYHKWFDVVRREFIQAKLDALGVAPAISRLISSIYPRQRCRQITVRGISAGRYRGLAGILQGSQGSPTWSLLMQDPLWVGIEMELRRSGGGLLAFGIPIPPRPGRPPPRELLGLRRNRC